MKIWELSLGYFPVLAGQSPDTFRPISILVPEVMLLLVSNKNHGLWPGLIFGACAEDSIRTFSPSALPHNDRKSVIHKLPVLDLPAVKILGADQTARGLWGQEIMTNWEQGKIFNEL